MKKTVLLIDAGYLKEASKNTGFFCDKKTVVKIANSCHIKAEEELYKILYYDCASFDPVNPDTGAINQKFINKKTGLALEKLENFLIKQLAQEDLFAIRLGKLKFDGWLENNKPSFRQKGVDMRIGLDIAHISHQNKIDRIILITADTDFIPAMKYARKSNIQIVLTRLGKNYLSPELKAHADFTRPIDLEKLELTSFKKK
ncbi:hypothetical protein MNB_SUP05-SYMBIONT-5-570 [hydrothermal vent metagenome]|uniref:NYN domain-containing protein n=1 Tax=hydrothermal vent metagenome TaxID=652676 RepID=A0A1W1E0M0_9ZZZZ